MTESSSDRILVKRLKNGDSSAFEELVNEYQGMILNTCFGFTHMKNDAEDLTQEVFIQVYRSIDSFREDSKLSTWLYRIAVNKSLNFLRKRKNSSWVQQIEDILFSDEAQSLSTGQQASPLGILENNEKAEQLSKAIQKLPENQKSAFVLSKYQGLSNKEVANIMESSVSATEALLNRAKKNLQKILLDYFYDK